MKQHITVDQFNELSAKRKEKLRAWWISHIQEGDLYVDSTDPVMFETIACCEDELDGDDVPLLSIGQMIEFLDEYTEDSGFIDGHFEHQIGASYDFEGPPYSIAWKGGELCDDLWAAVKEILEKL